MIYVGLPWKYLGREMLIASTISEASDTDLGTIGYKPKDPMHVKFTLVDSLICLNSVNLKPNFNKSNTELSNAIGLSSMDPILSTHPVFCYNKDSSAVVFEMTSLFTGHNDALSPMTKGGSGVNVTGTFNSKASILTDIKAFVDTVTIKSLL